MSCEVRSYEYDKYDHIDETTDFFSSKPKK